MQEVLEFIYLDVYVCMKEYKNILYVYIQKRVWADRSVKKMKVWKIHRGRAQEEKRMGWKENEKKKNWIKKPVTEG